MAVASLSLQTNQKVIKKYKDGEKSPAFPDYTNEGVYEVAEERMKCCWASRAILDEVEKAVIEARDKAHRRLFKAKITTRTRRLAFEITPTTNAHSSSSNTPVHDESNNNNSSSSSNNKDDDNTFQQQLHSLPATQITPSQTSSSSSPITSQSSLVYSSSSSQHPNDGRDDGYSITPRTVQKTRELGLTEL